MLQQLFQSCSIVFQDSDPKTDGNGQCALFSTYRLISSVVTQAFGGNSGVRYFCFGLQYDKLFTAIAAKNIHLP
jgi:hypothetical protein